MQEMKGQEGTGDPGGLDAKSRRYPTRSGLCPSGEKDFFADLPWRSQNSIANSSTTSTQILNPIAGDRWAQCQPHRGIKDVSVTSEPMKSLTIIVVVFIGPVALSELNADSFTTGGLILDLIAEGYWARCQLHDDVGPIPPLCLFMKL